MNKSTQKTTKPSRNVEAETPKDSIYEETQVFESSGYVTRNEEIDWDYNPEGDLEITEELAQYFREQGLVLRWARHTKDDKLDTKSLNKNQNKGYEFVKFESIPEHLRGKYETLSIDSFEGCVTQGDVVLMAAPLWKNEKVKQFLEGRALANPNAVKRLLQQETGISNDGAFKYINESTSKEKIGGTREVSYANRAK